MIRRNFTWSVKIAIDKYNKLEMELENESWRVKIVEKKYGQTFNTYICLLFLQF